MRTDSHTSACPRDFTKSRIIARISQRLISSAIVVHSKIRVCHLVYVEEQAISNPYFTQCFVESKITSAWNFHTAYYFIPSFEEYLPHMREVLRHIFVTRLTINSKEVQTCRETLDILGHIIYQGSAVQTLPRPVPLWNAPTNVKELQAFLGLMAFYRNFIPSTSAVAIPSTSLLRHDSG